MSKDKEASLIPAETTPVQSTMSEPARLLQLAVEKGADIDTLERLTALFERYQEREANAALVKAINEFQARCPVVLKQNVVDVTTREGKQGPKYKFASLTDIKLAIRPLLDELGLSIAFSVTDDDSHVVCTVRHRDGASESSQFPIRLDAKMKVNDSQRIASAISYARRYALTGALGIDTTDDDGKAAGEAPEHENPAADENAPKAKPRGERVTKEEIKKLVDEWKTYNPDDPAEFADWVESTTGIPAANVRQVAAWDSDKLAACFDRIAAERGDPA